MSPIGRGVVGGGKPSLRFDSSAQILRLVSLGELELAAEKWMITCLMGWRPTPELVERFAETAARKGRAVELGFVLREARKWRVKVLNEDALLARAWSTTVWTLPQAQRPAAAALAMTAAAHLQNRDPESAQSSPKLFAQVIRCQVFSGAEASSKAFQQFIPAENPPPVLLASKMENYLLDSKPREALDVYNNSAMTLHPRLLAVALKAAVQIGEESTLDSLESKATYILAHHAISDQVDLRFLWKQLGRARAKRAQEKEASKSRPAVARRKAKEKSRPPKNK